jgi:hypothetical protein
LETTVAMNKVNTLQRPVHTTVEDLESIKQIVHLRGLNLEQGGNRAKASSTKFRDVESRTSSPASPPNSTTLTAKRSLSPPRPPSLILRPPWSFQSPQISQTYPHHEWRTSSSAEHLYFPEANRLQFVPLNPRPMLQSLCASPSQLTPHLYPTASFLLPQTRITHPSGPATYQNLTPEQNKRRRPHPPEMGPNGIQRASH